MRLRCEILTTIVLLLSAFASAAWAADAQDLRVAIYFNPVRGERAAAYGGMGLKMALDDHGFDARYVRSLDEQTLKDFHVLLMPCVLGFPEAWNLDEVRQQQRKFAERGGGIVLMHESIGWRGAFKDRPVFPEIGRGVIVGGAGAPVSLTPLEVVDRGHPVTKELPERFPMQYDAAPLAVGEKGKVLVKLADEAMMRGKPVKLQDVPAVIVGEHGKGRVVLLGPLLGLDRLPRELENPPKGACLTLLLESVKWASRVQSIALPPVGIYFNPAPGKQRAILGYQGARLALEDEYEGQVRYVRSLDPETLRGLKVLILPCVHGYPEEWKEDELRANLRAFVAAGGGIVLMNESIGWRRAMANAPPFPEIGRATGKGAAYMDSVDRGVGPAHVKYVPLKVAAEAHPVTRGVRTFAALHDMPEIVPGDKGRVLVTRAEGGAGAVVAGTFGKGRVVLIAPTIGVGPRDMEQSPSGAARTLLRNSVSWAGSLTGGAEEVEGMGPSPPSHNRQPRVPRIASSWFRIVEYPQRHLNDFCLFRDQQGVWHAIGIMGTGTWASETALFHSTGRSLRERFENRQPLFEQMPREIGPQRSKNQAPQKHAPFVAFHDGLYHLFYRRPRGTTLVVRSADPWQWPDEAEVVFEQADARDVCVVKIGGAFHMYYCQAAEFEGTMRSCILLRKSTDLRRWSEPAIVHGDTSRECRHSRLESPFVVAGPGGWYLFVRNRSLDERTATTVYYSESPERFPSGRQQWFAELDEVHAPEIVECEGRHYIARVSGPPHANPRAPSADGWVEVAELKFE